MTDQLTDFQNVEDTTPEPSDQDTTEMAENASSSEQEVKQFKPVPYQEFRKSRAELRAAKQENSELRMQLEQLAARMDEYAKVKPQGTNGDSVNKQVEANRAKFRQSYSKADELYEDFIANLPQDDRFTDMLLEALDKKGEKVEDWMFNALMRKQERAAKMTEQEIAKETQRNTQILRNLEAQAFADDPEGFQKFKEFAFDAVSDKDHPYRGDLEDLYAIFRKSYKREDVQKETVKKIARTSKPGTKPSPKLSEKQLSNMSWDDVVKATLAQ